MEDLEYVGRDTSEDARDHSPTAGGPPLNAEQLEQHLQLVQLCFGEHEFGVALDEGAAGPQLQTTLAGTDGVSTEFDFDPLAFIEEKMSHGVPLDHLRRDLGVFMQYVYGKITQHVNTDVHTAFVSVSGYLMGTQEELQYVQRPLTSAIKRVQTAREELSEMTTELHLKLQHAIEVEEERLFDTHFLKLLLMYEKIASGVDDYTMREAAASRHSAVTPTGAAGSIGSSSVDVESLVTAALLNPQMLMQLEMLAMSAQCLRTMITFLPCLAQRETEREEAADLVRRSTMAVNETLCRTFSALCWAYIDNPSARTEKQLSFVVRMYEQTLDSVSFGKMVSSSILVPLLECILSWKATTQARRSADETVRLLQEIEEQLKRRVLPLLALLRHSFHTTPLYPAATVLWPALCEVLTKKLVSLYEVGIPHAFHQKYTAALRLLALVEDSCECRAELEALRCSPEVALWNHKWNTEVYTALRVTELAKVLTTALEPYEKRKPLVDIPCTVSASPSVSSASLSVGEYRLEVFRVLQEQLKWLFSTGVFLFPCTPQFLREIVMSFHRVAKTVVSYFQATAQTDACKDDVYFRLLMDVMMDLNSLGCFYVEELQVIVNAAMFGSQTSSLLSQNKGDRSDLRNADEQCSNVVKNIVELARSGVSKIYIEEVRRMIISRIETAVYTALQNVKSVRSAYSHTKKPYPTESSWYVPSVVEPISKLVVDASNRGLKGELLHDTLRVLVDDVSDQFMRTARETLLAAKKTEESWEKLRRRREVGTTGIPNNAESTMTTRPSSINVAVEAVRVTPDKATDRDKMMLQLHMDATTYAEYIMTHGFTVENSAPLRALFNLLRRAEWIRGADIPEPPDIDENDQ